MLTKRILALLAAGVMACTVLAGCTSAPQNGTESSSQTAQTEAYYTFTDALGKEVVLHVREDGVHDRRDDEGDVLQRHHHQAVRLFVVAQGRHAHVFAYQ